MEINGVWLSDFERIVNRVSREQYNGNLKVNDDAHPLRVSRRDHLRGLGNTRARLSVKDSYAHGARTTWTGRHGRYASWEAYRDVLQALFDEYPDARVRTGLANYVGRAGFQELYPATAYHNVGSTFNPLTMPDLTVEAPVQRSRTAQEIQRYRDTVAQNEARFERARVARREARERAEQDEQDRHNSTKIGMVEEIDKLLAEVAEEGWTNPYEHEDSPARKLA